MIRITTAELKKLTARPSAAAPANDDDYCHLEEQKEQDLPSLVQSPHAAAAVTVAGPSRPTLADYHRGARANPIGVWADCQDEIPDPTTKTEHRGPSAAQLATLTAVPSHFGGGRREPLANARGRRGKGTRKGKRASASKSIAFGNDQRVPWLKRPSPRHEIEVSMNFPTTFLSTSSAGLPVFAALYFIVSTHANWSSFAAVFDEYCIKEVECVITPTYTEISTGSNVGSYLTAIDIDDSTVPTTLADLTAYESCVDTRATQSHYHRWVPQFAVATYSGAFTSYSSTTGWIDCASPNVEHYGLKIGLSIASTPQSFWHSSRIRVGLRSTH